MIEQGLADAGASGTEWTRFADRETLRRFAGPNFGRFILAAAQEWLAIAVAVGVCLRFPHWWVWIPGMLFIGSRQHSFGILAHEGVHYLVHRKRWLNDLAANLLSAYPITYPVEAYRVAHLKHHRTLDTPEDPERVSVDLYPREWTYPMPAQLLMWIHFKDIVGLSARSFLTLVKYIWAIRLKDWYHGVFIALYHAAWWYLAWQTGHIVALVVLWYVPLLTVAPTCFRLRTAAEHSGIYDGERRYTQPRVNTIGTTRTVTGGPIASYLFAPHNMAYHIEHHLFPYVPVFRLRDLHHEMMKNPDYRAQSHVTHGYDRLFAELTRMPAEPVTKAAS
jgi:fatty acid desaturase